jgi:predicted PurR-regulated permease PerM
MLGIDARAARYTWTATLVVLLLYVIYLVRGTLFVFTLALLLAYLLFPLVNLLDRFLPGRTRTPALALAYVIFIGILVVAGIQIGSRMVSQATKLANDFPTMFQNWQPPGQLGKVKTDAVAKIQSEFAGRAENLLGLLPQAGAKFLSVASGAVYIVIIPILSFFFLKDASAIRERFLDLVTEGPRRVLIDDVLADIHLLLAHYMRALVLLSLAVFTAFSVGFSIMGMRFSILLGALGGMLEFIPMVGPLMACAVIVLVAAVSGMNIWPVLIFLVAYRVFQDYILSPHLMKQGVQLHPLLVLFGVFAGAEIAGVAGTFLSVPVLAMVRVVYVRIRKSRVGAKPAVE